MATEPTTEAIKAHQRRILEEAIENARETINLPSEFYIELENALDENERGDVDRALEIAQQVRDEAESLSSALDDIAFSLKHIDEEPAPASGVEREDPKPCTCFGQVRVHSTCPSHGTSAPKDGGGR